MDFNAFMARITSVEKSPQRYFIVDPDLPLSVYFGLDNQSRPTLLIEDIGKTFSVSDIPSTAQILVRSYMEDGKACLSFSVLSSEHRDVFNTLCYDLFESTRKETKEQALLSLLSRFSAWVALLKGTRPGIMSLQEQQGLAAELMALVAFAEKRGFGVAIDAWVGPFKLDKDFEFFDYWAEIKSCKVSATTVSISSIEQLDAAMDGSLIVYRIDQAPENKEDAYSLKDVVDKARSAATNAAERTMLENKLLLSKYVDAESEYHKRKFKTYSCDSYRVDSQFPCLRRDGVNPAITACQYSISLPAVEAFKEAGQ
jgi:hypothetical protein